MIGAWIPGIVWQRIWLKTREVVDLQIERDDDTLVVGLALDPCGWPLEHRWEIAPARIVKRAPRVQSVATGLLEDVDTWPTFGASQLQ